MNYLRRVAMAGSGWLTRVRPPAAEPPRVPEISIVTMNLPVTSMDRPQAAMALRPQKVEAAAREMRPSVRTAAADLRRYIDHALHPPMNRVMHAFSALRPPSPAARVKERPRVVALAKPIRPTG